ncbi:hypothetical protein GQF03_17410 [Sneathiella chungangensis]|uniref:Twin-arginine translocation signal domain-containing protein n=1 Tax=Sneathiella chungangensis TaxID=1418234 RepID=A0A845MKG0_9PROT|nr:hypothetical protein [Sneathiella chungangensis]MZR24115.1 hypothetical protein [Sneathiella chungangensis]
MANLYIDSKSPKFDRRSALKGAAALSLAAVPAFADTDPSLQLWAKYEAQQSIEIEALNRLEEAAASLPRVEYKFRYGVVDSHEALQDVRTAWEKFNSARGIQADLKTEFAAYHKGLDKVLAGRRQAEARLNISGLAATYEAEAAKGKALLIEYLDTDPTTAEGLARRVEELFCLGEDFQPSERCADLVSRLPALVRRAA